MSTEYSILTSGDFELTLTEISSKADLALFEGQECHQIKRRMDAKELTRIGLEFLKVASYLEGDLTECMKDQDGYVVSELRRIFR